MENHTLITQTAEMFPWYHSLANLRALTASAEPLLSELPFITEAVLAEHYYHAENPHLADGLSYLTSGTSSHKRKRVFYSLRDQAAYKKQRLDIFRNFIGAGMLRGFSDIGTGHAADTAYEIFTSLGMLAMNIDFRSDIEEHVQSLNAFQPDVFFTMPAIINNLMKQPDLRIKPRKIILVGDVASRAWQKNVADFFSLKPGDILDIYGCIEIGAIAHFNHELDAYELGANLRPEAVPALDIYPNSPRQSSPDILVLTSTTREYFPALRYVTNDTIHGFETIVHAGRSKTIFHHCGGRFADALKHGEKISLYDIDEAMGRFFPGKRYEVSDREGILSIQIEQAALDANAVTQLKQYLLETNPEVEHMVASRLIGDIDVQPGRLSDAASTTYKRRYTA